MISYPKKKQKIQAVEGKRTPGTLQQVGHSLIWSAALALRVRGISNTTFLTDFQKGGGSQFDRYFFFFFCMYTDYADIYDPIYVILF